jgi:hypothetical protein
VGKELPNLPGLISNLKNQISKTQIKSQKENPLCPPLERGRIVPGSTFGQLVLVFTPVSVTLKIVEGFEVEGL